VRLENVDAPELHCRCILECRQAQAARAFTQEAVANGVTLQRQQTRAGQPRTDRYRRTIARVTLPDGRDLGELLVARGLGRPYHGERRQSWCN
jgi:endonuclease YncB( thermonuclease family)